MSHKTAQSPFVLETMKPSKAIVKLALPATLALLAKAVYNLVDTAYIGMLDNDLAMAGIYVSQPAADVLTILVCVCSIRKMKEIASSNMNNCRTP